jgi:hypothetical protein
MVLYGAFGKTSVLGHTGDRRLGIANLCQQANRRVADTLASASTLQLLQSLFRSHTFPLSSVLNATTKKPYGWLFILLVLGHWEILRETLGESACRS